MLRLRLPPIPVAPSGPSTLTATGTLQVVSGRTGQATVQQVLHFASGTLVVTADRAGAATGGATTHTASGSLVAVAGYDGTIGVDIKAAGNRTITASRTGSVIGGENLTAAGTLTVTAARVGSAATPPVAGVRTVTANRTGAAVTLRGATGSRITTANRVGVASVTGAPSGTTWQGVSNSTWNHQFAQWDAVRGYKLNTMNGLVSEFNPKMLAITDDPNVSLTGGQASADKVHAALTTFFASHPNVKVHWANNNEVDRDNPNMAQFVNTCAAMRDAIDDFPGKAEMWIDLTQNNIRTNDSANRFAAVAPYLHGVGSSCYPPGRMNNPSTTSPLDTFVDPVFDVAEQWGVGQVACWEIGTPISSNYNRPNYVETWVDRFALKRDQTGISVAALIWWDNQSDAGTADPGPDNRFQTDGALTATRWRQAIAAM